MQNSPDIFTGSVRVCKTGAGSQLFIVGLPVQWTRETDVVVPLAFIRKLGRVPLRYGTMTVRWKMTPNGRLATEILAYDASTERPDTIGELSPDARTTHAGGPLKWFNYRKGYGFLMTSAGDCLVHAATLHRCGIFGLSQNERLFVEMVKTERGWLALNVERESRSG